MPGDLVEKVAALLYQEHPMFLGQHPVPWEALTPEIRADRTRTAEAALACVAEWLVKGARATDSAHQSRSYGYVAAAIRREIEGAAP